MGKRGRQQTAAVTAPVSTRQPWANRLFDGACLFGLVVAGVAVDPWAEAVFDAPKRALTLVAAAVIAVALAAMARPIGPGPIAPLARHVASGAAILMALLLLSMLANRTTAALPMLLLGSVWCLAGAARCFTPGLGARLLAAGVIVALVNGGLSLWQHIGALPGLQATHLGGRFDTGALFGNEGQVAAAAALAVVLAIGLLWHRPAWRGRASLLLVLMMGVIVINRQLTAQIAVGAGAFVWLMTAIGRPRWIAGAVAIAAVSVAIVLTPLFTAAGFSHRQAFAQSLQDHGTQRLAAYAAAAEMIRDAPWLGHGPGSYARASLPNRLAAEQHHHLRLSPPASATHFDAAHNDYLQLAAEAGLPALALALAVLGALGLGLLRLLRRRKVFEPALLLALGVTLAVLALAWFPLQVPFTAVIALLLLGRSWRLIADAETEAA